MQLEGIGTIEARELELLASSERDGRDQVKERKYLCINLALFRKTDAPGRIYFNLVLWYFCE
jgi:hypothetical protein